MNKKTMFKVVLAGLALLMLLNGGQGFVITILLFLAVYIVVKYKRGEIKNFSDLKRSILNY